MAPRNESRTRLVVGFVVSLVALGALSMYVIGQSEGSWNRKSVISSDFRTIAGLRRGSPVQLAGVEIGTVTAIDFVQRRYSCDPLTEDVGRWGSGRSDRCDEFLFCGPLGECAELELYASPFLHSLCQTADDCSEEEICVNHDFRKRARRVQWTGPDGVCARYTTEHRRVQVTMTVFADKLEIIRTDSLATIASNGVLGDQLVNITPGTRERLDELPPEQRRISSTPSLYEDIALFRQRIDGLTMKVDDSLTALSELFSGLNDEKTVTSLKHTIVSVEEITRQVADGKGVIGALVSDPKYKEEFADTLRSVQKTAQGAQDFVSGANRSLAKIEANIDPTIVEAREVIQRVGDTLRALKDPENKSLAAKLLYDSEGKMSADAEQAIIELRNAAETAKRIIAEIETGNGTMGKLVYDSKVHDDLVKILQNLERNETFKRLTRLVIELDEGEQAKAKAKRSDR